MMIPFLNYIFLLKKIIKTNKHRSENISGLFYLNTNKRHREQIVLKLATDDYSLNSLQHYHFNIEGKHYIYGIIEIQYLEAEAQLLRKKISQFNHKTQ